MKRILKIIDNISEWVGRISSWLILLLILILTFEVISRYVFNSPTIWANELSSMLLGTIIALGWAYTHKHDGHIRVDVLYNIFPHKVRKIIDLVCFVIMFVPLIVFIMYRTFNWLIEAIVNNEVLTKGIWYPPVWPIRLMFLIGLGLFLLQGIAQFIRDIQQLVQGEPS